MPDNIDHCLSSMAPGCAQGPNSWEMPSQTTSSQSRPVSASTLMPYTPTPTTTGVVGPSKRSVTTEKEKSRDVMRKVPGAPPPSKIARTLSMSLNEGYNPPDNFALVGSSVYRSSFPKRDNFSYLKKLRLKTILTLVPEPYPVENLEFMQEHNITHYQIGMPGNKEPFVNIPDESISTALRIILDRRNHPILIHCNKGKHRTGCVVGCLRKLQSWSLSLIFDEYRRFAGAKARPLDQLNIELYKEDACRDFAKEHGWIPSSLIISNHNDENGHAEVLPVVSGVAIKAQ